MSTNYSYKKAVAKAASSLCKAAKNKAPNYFELVLI